MLDKGDGTPPIYFANFDDNSSNQSELDSDESMSFYDDFTMDGNNVNDASELLSITFVETVFQCF